MRFILLLLFILGTSAYAKESTFKVEGKEAETLYHHLKKISGSKFNPVQFKGLECLFDSAESKVPLSCEVDGQKNKGKTSELKSFAGIVCKYSTTQGTQCYLDSGACKLDRKKYFCYFSSKPKE